MRRSLEERRARLAYQGAADGRGGRLRRFLETEVWPYVPPSIQDLGIRSYFSLTILLLCHQSPMRNLAR